MAVGMVVYAARRRIRLALTVGAVAYLVLIGARFLLLAITSDDLFDRLEAMAVPAAVLLVVWVLLWRLSIVYERRKLAARGRPGGQEAGRRRR